MLQSVNLHGHVIITLACLFFKGKIDLPRRMPGGHPRGCNYFNFPYTRSCHHMVMGSNLENSPKLTNVHSNFYLYKQKNLSSPSSFLAHEGYPKFGEQVSRHVCEEQSSKGDGDQFSVLTWVKSQAACVDLGGGEGDWCASLL